MRPAKGKNDRSMDDPIARVKARSVALANFLSNYTLGLDGQEELMAVQYNAGQQYMLHCDGSCDGSPFVGGGRLATVLMYCATADGGGTAFPNANVHVVPKKGQAVYFHFRGPEPDGVVEDWHTEHSGCPVKSGEKWVVTQWLRDGVSKQFPRVSAASAKRKRAHEDAREAKEDESHPSRGERVAARDRRARATAPLRHSRFDPSGGPIA